jgi:hypothetical protein
MSVPDMTKASMSTRLVVLVATLFAIACVLTVGRKSSSGVLIALFVLWVFIPFGALGLLIKASSGWGHRKHQILQGLSLAVCVVAAFVYGAVAFASLPAKPAFWFLVLPPALLVMIGTTYMATLRK